MKNKNPRIGIVGAGLIGAKRAHGIRKTKRGILVGIADVDHARAKALAAQYGVEAAGEWKQFVARKDIDAIVVAVPNAFAAPIVLAALKAGKHVLCEKPFGITSKESKAMAMAATRARRIVKVGFNHRFHDGILKAHEIVEAGGIGKVLFIRCRYGHGGRKGMEKEWRFDKKISGGGELLDQGVHVVDLARWFAGEFDEVYCAARTKFWEIKVDDNSFVLMMNARTTVSFHVSATQWENLFSFEVFGDKGFVQIDGKKGGYGEEVLTYAKANLGFAPSIQIFRFRSEDMSWENEWKNFMDAIAGEAKVNGDAEDGLRANLIIEALYASSKARKNVRLKG